MQSRDLVINSKWKTGHQYVEDIGMVSYEYRPIINQVLIKLPNSGVYGIPIQWDRGSREINGVMLEVYIK